MFKMVIRVFRKQTKYYHIDDVPKRRGGKRSRLLMLSLALLMFVGGVYLLVLTQSPEILNTEVLAAPDESALVNNSENFVKIERINALVPFYEGNSEATLEKGAWHRYPERGDPVKGGNFILSAHRFKLGLTPNQTKERSPFYHLDEVQVDDTIDVFFDGQWYSYKVTKTYSVSPEAVEIENPSEEAKLTLYTCSLKGSADGRVVIEAVPYSRTPGVGQSTNDNPLL